MPSGSHSRIRVVVGLAALVAACASEQAPMGLATGPVVSDFDLRGTAELSADDVKDKLLTAETGWWPWAKERRFDPLVWQSDLRRIERFYEARGYYGTAVVQAEVFPRGQDEVALAVSIEEGAPVRIASLEVLGLEPLAASERELVLEDLPLEEGDLFVENDWSAAKQIVRTRLRNRGYAAASLMGKAEVDLAKHGARLQVVVDPGRRYRFGEIEIEQGRGASVPTYRIREQVRLALGENRLFSEEDLEEAQARLFNLNVFSTARVEAGTPDPESGRVPVKVEVREAPFRTLRLGAGMGIDQVRQEARMLAGWTHRNFFGGLRLFGLKSTLGWAFIPSSVAVARNEIDARQGPVFQATGEFQQPRLFGRPTLSLRPLLEVERTIEPAYDAIGGRSQLGVNWQPTSRVSVFPSYNLQLYRLNGPSAASAATAPLSLGCSSDPCRVLLSYLEQVVSWDRRDHPLEPTLGFYVSLSLQEGGGPLGGDFSYFRFLPDARAYVSFGDEASVTFATRLRLGSLVPRSGRPEDSPVVSRFYAGGPNSMRGFGLRRLSPMVLIPLDPDDPSSRVALPVGGNGLLEGSFEMRVRTSENLLLATFLDYGTVTRSRLPIEDPRRLLFAVGAGLRYLSPIGPIRVDLGFRLPYGRPPPLFDQDGQEITYRRLADGGVVAGSETGANVDKSCFGFGGGGGGWVENGLCSLHISIGEAF